MSAELDDQSLVRAAQSGDLEAFNRLVDRYQDLLFRIALRMLGDEDNAADAAQVAWISAFRKLNDFRGGRLRTWLTRVVINTCYDEIRRRHWRREVALLPVDAEGEEIEADSWLPDPAPGVEERVDASEFNQMIQDSLRLLHPAYRTMLILVDIEGLSYEEAALAAGVPMGTVRSRLARARMAVRERLRASADLAPSRPRFEVSQPRSARAKYQ